MAEPNRPVAVLKKRPQVIMIPLVRISGTGKVSSTVKANITGVVGTTEIPIKSITKASNIKL